MSQLLPSCSILAHFSALSDPRQRWRVLYPLPEILLLVLCATLSGMEDFVEIRLWGEQRLDFLRRFLPYERGLPAHDTLNDVINGLDAELFKTCFSNWVETLRDHAPDMIAIDGKTSRRTHARRKGREPLHLVSAWAARQRIVLGQEAVDAKSNEIVAIPLLLERLQLTGALVTIDAMGTQTDIAERIVGRGGDYLLALKANRPVLHQDVATFFDNPPADMLEPRHNTTDGDHGRVEERRHVVCHKVDWLFSDRRYADEPRFPHLAMIGMVESRVERNGTVAKERRYYLSSTRLDAKTFAAAVRAHWGVENRLHWVLDVVFHDDLARLRTLNGPQNMAVVKHMAMNLVRNPRDKHSLKVRRKLANLNPDYLENMIRQTAPEAIPLMIGCRVLTQPFFFDRAQWLQVPKSFALTTVTFKGCSTDDHEGLQLWDAVQGALQQTPACLEFDEIPQARYGEPVLVRPRLGQGAFRILVTDNYRRRCAVSGERTLPALDAAHIRPFADGGSHEVSNGILLRRDIHSLFDLGYVTITPDMRFEVSGKIREEYENGRHYYALHGTSIQLPEDMHRHPDRSALDWHNTYRFKG